MQSYRNGRAQSVEVRGASPSCLSIANANIQVPETALRKELP